MPHFVEEWPDPGVDDAPPPPRDARVIIEVVGGAQADVSTEGSLRLRVTAFETVEALSVMLRAEGLGLRPTDRYTESDPTGLETLPGYSLLTNGLLVFRTPFKTRFHRPFPLNGEAEWTLPIELARGTAPGVYTVEIVEAEVVTDVPEVIRPQLVGGTFEIREPVVDRGHRPFPELLFDLDERRVVGDFEIRTTSAEGGPGDEVQVVVEVRGERPVNRLPFTLQFPSSALTLEEVVPLYADPITGEVKDNDYYRFWAVNGATTWLWFEYNRGRGHPYPGTVGTISTLNYIGPLGGWVPIAELRFGILDGARGREEIPLRLLGDTETYIPVFEPYFECNTNDVVWRYEPTIYSPGVIQILGGGEPPSPPEPPIDPRDAEIRFRVGEARGDPGDLVRVPIFFESAVDLFQVRPVLGFDTGRLELEGVEVPIIDPSGDPTEPELLTPDLDGGAFVNEECIEGPDGVACTGGLPFIGVLRREPPDELPPGHLIVDLQTTWVITQGEFFPGPLSWEPGVEHLLGTALLRIREDAPLGRVPIEAASVEWHPASEAERVVSESSGYPILDFLAERADVPALEVLGGVVTIGPTEREFIRGDADLGGVVELTDAVYTLNHLFLRGPALRCEDAGDANDDGVVNLTDAVYTLTFLFLVGPPPAEPYPEAGLDPTPDGIPCAADEQG